LNLSVAPESVKAKEAKLGREEVKKMLSSSEEIKFGGSASHLNSRVPETLRD